MPDLDYHNSQLQISFNEDNEWEVSRQRRPWTKYYVLKATDAHGIKVKVKKKYDFGFL